MVLGDLSLRSVVVSLYQCGTPPADSGECSNGGYADSGEGLPTRAEDYRGDILLPFLSAATYAEMAASLEWRLSQYCVEHGARGERGGSPATCKHARCAAAEALSLAAEPQQLTQVLPGLNRGASGRHTAAATAEDSLVRYHCESCRLMRRAVAERNRPAASSVTAASPSPPHVHVRQLAVRELHKGGGGAFEAVPASSLRDIIDSGAHRMQCFFYLCADAAGGGEGSATPSVGSSLHDPVLCPAAVAGEVYAQPVELLRLPTWLTAQVGDSVVRVACGAGGRATLYEGIVDRLGAQHSGRNRRTAPAAAAAATSVSPRGKEVSLPATLAMQRPVPQLFILDPTTGASILPCERVSVIASLVSLVEVTEPGAPQDRKAATRTAKSGPRGQLESNTMQRILFSHSGQQHYGAIAARDSDRRRDGDTASGGLGSFISMSDGGTAVDAMSLGSLGIHPHRQHGRSDTASADAGLMVYTEELDFGSMALNLEDTDVAAMVANMLRADTEEFAANNATLCGAGPGRALEGEYVYRHLQGGRDKGPAVLAESISVFSHLTGGSSEHSSSAAASSVATIVNRSTMKLRRVDDSSTKGSGRGGGELARTEFGFDVEDEDNDEEREEEEEEDELYDDGAKQLSVDAASDLSSCSRASDSPEAQRRTEGHKSHLPASPHTLIRHIQVFSDASNSNSIHCGQRPCASTPPLAPSPAPGGGPWVPACTPPSAEGQVGSAVSAGSYRSAESLHVAGPHTPLPGRTPIAFTPGDMLAFSGGGGFSATPVSGSKRPRDGDHLLPAAAVRRRELIMCTPSDEGSSGYSSSRGSSTDQCTFSSTANASMFLTPRRESAPDWARRQGGRGGGGGGDSFEDGADPTASARVTARRTLMALMSPRPAGAPTGSFLQSATSVRIPSLQRSQGDDSQPALMFTQQQLPEYIFGGDNDNDDDDDDDEDSDGGSGGDGDLIAAESDGSEYLMF